MTRRRLDGEDDGIGCVVLGMLIILALMGASLFQAARIPHGFAP